MTVSFSLDGRSVEAVSSGSTSLLEALREGLGVRSVKDGCSPQGQCGCCTVLVDGAPRVACVTPLERVAGRTVTTFDGLDDADGWAEAMSCAGANQCGFCTPGIAVRAAALDPARRGDEATVRRALLAHLCRCTGWQPIVDAVVGGPAPSPTSRDEGAARRRASLEAGVDQHVGPDVAAGGGGFAEDTAPSDALAAVLDASGEWVVAESLGEARRLAGTVQGRRSTASLSWPVEVPAGAWHRTLQTTWVEPGYLEPDASWCVPGGKPATALANGGAFGGKSSTNVGEVARRLANEHGRPVRAVYSREDVVRRGPKRPPLAFGFDIDGRGIVRIGHSGHEDPALAEAAAIEAVALAGLDPTGVHIESVAVSGPPTSVALRGAAAAELLAVGCSLGDGPDAVTAADGAWAEAEVGDGGVRVRVRCGDPLDEVVLRSYCTGAAHMALGMVRNEGIAVDASGVPLDLTIRSFGILRAQDTPLIDVGVEVDDRPPCRGSEAVFAAVLAASWRAEGFPARWPAQRS